MKLVLWMMFGLRNIAICTCTGFLVKTKQLFLFVINTNEQVSKFFLINLTSNTNIKKTEKGDSK